MSIFIVSLYMCSLVCCNDMAIFKCWWITSKGQWKKCSLFFISNLVNCYITLIHVTFNKMEILQRFKYLESWLNVNQRCCFVLTFQFIYNQLTYNRYQNCLKNRHCVKYKLFWWLLFSLFQWLVEILIQHSDLIRPSQTCWE